MASQRPQYQPIEENVKEETVDLRQSDPVQVRTRRIAGNRKSGLSLRQRLSQIVSVYIPNRDQTGDGDGYCLLQGLGGSEMDEATLARRAENENARSSGLYRVNNFYRVEKHFSLDALTDKNDAIPISEIVSATTVDEAIYIALAGSSELLAITLPNTVRRIPLLLENKPFYPNQIIYRNSVLYISGYNQRNGQRCSLLAKYNKEGRLIAKTKQYPFNRFGGFDVDADGHLLIASPQISIDKTAASQVFKLSGGFEKKSYHIDLGSKRSTYFPTWVAAHSVGYRAWVSVVRTPREPTSETTDSSAENHRRLLSFPCCRTENIPTTSNLRDWLKIESWSFESLEPSHIAALGPHQLLVLDAEHHNLHSVTWDLEHGRPILRKLTEPGDAIFSGISIPYGDNTHAYLYTARDVYLFTFVE